jgi:hypothetical protein
MSIQKSKVTFGKALKAGMVVGLIAAGLNNIWSFIAQMLGSEALVGFPIAVTVSSVFTMLVGAIIYFVFVKISPKGETVFIVIAVIFTLISLYPTFTTTQLQDGTPVGNGFTLLTLPMHIISGGLAVWGIPKFSK